MPDLSSSNVIPIACARRRLQIFHWVGCWPLTARLASFLVSLLMLGLLGACTTMPSGPSALVLPGTGKSFEQFRSDDFACRNYAQVQVGDSAQQASDNSALRSAALGTAIGALAGAAMDGHHGAGVGAGTGLAFGTLSGVGAGQGSAYQVQQRYDFAYQQCMYANGHRVPVAGSMANAAPSGAVAPANAAYPPPNAAYPPPNTPPPAQPPPLR